MAIIYDDMPIEAQKLHEWKLHGMLIVGSDVFTRDTYCTRTQ